MAEQSPSCPDDPASAAEAMPARPSWPWWLAIVFAFMMLVVLGWLLARLVWLPLYFGLFFFLVAGLLVGAVSFRIARPARPISRRRLILGIALLAVVSSLVTVVWEYRNVAATVGGKRKFPDARNVAVAAGRPVRQIELAATRKFTEALRKDYPPGGPVGYVRWATLSGEMDLTVMGCKDVISIAHRGWAWPIRSLAGVLLLAAGLWLSFESLASPSPVSNILAPGEEAEDEEDD